MITQTPSATRASLQKRLLARLIAAIYGITDALTPIVEAVATKPVHPWKERTRFADRFWAIIRELNILIMRVPPGILSPNPAFPPIRPRAPRPPLPAAPALATVEPAPTPPGPKTPFTPKPFTSKPFTSRQLAKRLALLLHKLECLAAEAGAALSAPFHRHAAQARAIAGCHALPPTPQRHPQAQSTWERAG